MSNPFSLTFGLKPAAYIDRMVEKDKIISDFSDPNPSNYVYLLTGIRGSGKTVFMYSISDQLKNENDWIVANIGTKTHMLEAVASEIYEQGKMKHLFLQSDFSFSFNGFGFSIQGKEPVSDIMSLLKKMLSYLEKKGKKVLITVDEVDNSDEMKYFIQGYASLLGQKHPMRLLMTGLYGNVSKLQNEKSLTFLYRAPKIQMGPLSIVAIANKYSSLLDIDYDSAIELAKFSKGYAYAYQVLGYLLFEAKKKEITKGTLSEFNIRLGEYVYEKVYSELNETSKTILKAIKEDKPIKLSELSSLLNKPANYLSNYRDTLIKEGVLYSPSYGYIQFALPQFDMFLKTK